MTGFKSKKETSLDEEGFYTLHPKFDGADYNPQRDDVRLTGQLLRIWNVVIDSRWHTLKEISEKTGDPEASVSAQLRHLRKPRFGGYTVEREYINNGLYKYRVLPKEETT
jgi:hypothetical protein